MIEDNKEHIIFMYVTCFAHLGNQNFNNHTDNTPDHESTGLKMRVYRSGDRIYTPNV